MAFSACYEAGEGTFETKVVSVDKKELNTNLENNCVLRTKFEVNNIHNFIQVSKDSQFMVILNEDGTGIKIQSLMATGQ